MIKRIPFLIVPLLVGLLLTGVVVSTAAAADINYGGYTHQNQNLVIEIGGEFPALCVLTTTYQARILEDSFPVGAGVLISVNLYASGAGPVFVDGETNEASMINLTGYMNANCDGTATVRSGDDSQILYSEPYTWEPPIVFTGTGTLTSFVDIPEPWPLPEITYTLNLAPFWDIASINRAISIIQTFFLFDNVQKFFQIFVPFSGFIIALKWMVGTYRSRRARTLQAIEEQ